LGELPAALRSLLNNLFTRLGIGQDLFSGGQEEVTAVPEQKAPENTEEAADGSASAQDETAETPVQEQASTAQADNLSYEKQVAQLVNEARAENGLSPLTLSGELSDIARLKSQDMHDNNYFDHTSPTYGDPFEMLTSFGVSYRAAGENIAVGYATPEAVVDAWMNSPGHRANILNASYTQIGVGYVADGNYWTQEFIG
jgi:uncharacterized YkwD family protein